MASEVFASAPEDSKLRELYPDPTPEMLNGDPLFDAIWGAIKGWDISRHNDGMYSGTTGNDVRHIYDAIRRSPQVTNEVRQDG